MTASHQRPGGGDGSPFGNLANRGVILVLVAVLIGFVLLAKGFGDRGDETAAASPETSTTTTAQSNTTTSVDGSENPGGTAANGNGSNGNGAPQTTVVEELHAEADVVVLAGNGSGESGVASELEAKLSAQGYVADAANANPTEASQILYRPGYALNAVQIAEGLGVATTVVVQIAADAPGPVPEEAAERAAASNIIVIAGSDGVIR